MYEDFFLNNSNSNIGASNDVNLDLLFNNLSNDVQNVNKMISDLNKQKQTNNNELDELNAERRKLHKMQEEFETYMRIQRADLKQKVNQTEIDVNNAKQALERARADFNSDMSKSLLELDVARKELDLEKEKFSESIKQFESYKQMEMDKIHHKEEILKTEREEFETTKKYEEEILKANQAQFEKYKEVCNQKLEIENKKMEQKFEKFKGIVSQFNDKFKPMTSDNSEE